MHTTWVTGGGRVLGWAYVLDQELYIEVRLQPNTFNLSKSQIWAYMFD